MAFEDLVACVCHDVSQMVSCCVDFLSTVVLFPVGWESWFPRTHILTLLQSF